MQNHSAAIGFWDSPPGARLRFAFGDSAENMRCIFWAQLSKDGSLYLAPRKKNYLKIGTKKATVEDLTIKYDEGEIISDPKLCKNPKVSFHASGIGNTIGRRFVNENLRELKEKHLLCQMLFQDPTAYEVLENIKKYDICINYPVDKNCPIACSVYIAPLKEFDNPVLIQDAKYQFSAVVRYEELSNIQDLGVQFLFYHRSEGAWPPATYMVWKDTGANKTGKENQTAEPVSD